jgi:hypothetical protein
MATTFKQGFADYGVHQVIITLTANDTVNFSLPRAFAIGFSAVSSDFGSGTVALKAGPDGTNYYALPTAKSLTASGVKSVNPEDCGFFNYQIALTGATNPATITVTLYASTST